MLYSTFIEQDSWLTHIEEQAVWIYASSFEEWWKMEQWRTHAEKWGVRTPHFSKSLSSRFSQKSNKIGTLRGVWLITWKPRRPDHKLEKFYCRISFHAFRPYIENLTFELKTEYTSITYAIWKCGWHTFSPVQYGSVRSLISSLFSWNAPGWLSDNTWDNSWSWSEKFIHFV